MLIVTGASGQLGRGVIAQLCKRLPASRIIASVRNPDAIGEIAAGGVTVRAGDFAAPDGLAATFAGAEQVLVVSVDRLGEAARTLHRSAFAAACAAGARRILYTSHAGARAGSPFAPADDHIAAEAVLAAGSTPFTALRHGFYAESAWHFVGHGIAAGEIIAPEDGPVSWTARADLAEADAILLAEEGRIDGVTPALTAGEALTMAELATIASELTGREIKCVTVSDDSWLMTMVARGTPEPVARMLLGMYQAARRGDFSAVDPTLAQLLGRPPQTMREVLAQRLSPVA